MPFNSAPNYDSRYIEDELYTSAQTWWVSTTGDDGNEGTNSSPLRTAYGAWLRISSRPQYAHRVHFMAGTHTLSNHFNNAYGQSNIFFDGDTPTESASQVVDTIVSNTRALGLKFSCVGVAWTPSEHKRKIIKWKTGALAGHYSCVKSNSATELVVTVDTTEWGTLLPVATDTFVFLTQPSILTMSTTIGTQFSKITLTDLKVTGAGKLATQSSIVQYTRCMVEFDQIAIGHNGVVRFNTSTFKQLGGSNPRGISSNPHSSIYVGKGSVLDFKTTQQVYLTEHSILELEGEVIFQNLSSSGITLRGAIIQGYEDNFATVDPTLELKDCAAGFIDDTYNNFAASDVNIAYIRGNISGNWLVNQLGLSSYKFLAGSVTTALGTNTCTVDGMIEGYAAPNRNAFIAVADKPFHSFYEIAYSATDYLADLNNDLIHITNTAAPRTVTLPTAACMKGKKYTVKDESGGAAGNNITIVGASGELFDGAASSVIATNYGSRTVVARNGAWWVI